MTKVPYESKSKRWSRLCATAKDALDQLKEMQDEYQEQLDNLPENLQSSARGEKLSTVCDLDLESAVSTIDEAEGTDLPLGFGRD